MGRQPQVCGLIGSCFARPALSGAGSWRALSFHLVPFRSAPQGYAGHGISTQGTIMTIVAQHYQPERPIAVGNRQSRVEALRSAAPRRARPVISTFPSLVGSFGNRLGVGNRQLSHIARHGAARRNTTTCNSPRRIPNSAATAFVRSLVGLSCLVALQLCAPLHRTVRCVASQRITLPSVVGLRAECGGYLLPTAARLRRSGRRCATFRNSSHLNEYLPSVGCLRATCGSQEPRQRC